MAKDSTNLGLPVPSPTYKATAAAMPGDNTGFHVLLLDPNFSWAVKS